MTTNLSICGARHLVADVAPVVSGENMKSLFLRSGVVLACALTLAACGGKGGNLLLSGSVVGVNRTGLVLQNNGANDLEVVSPFTNFVFPTLIGNDTDFNVTIKSSPSNADCTAFNNKGKTSNFDINNIVISCVLHTFDLGGSVSGLTTNGLVLANGSDRQTVPAGATSFTMTVPNKDSTGKDILTGKVADGSPYGITVLTQPAGQTCTVIGGTGIMGPGPVTTVQVSCA
jgi:hypothetical protein